MTSPLRILNVDDDQAVLYLKRRILSEAGHAVTDAASGSEALQALDGGGFHAALIDMKLPDMTGFELTRRIRSHPLARHLAVVQVSAICVTADDRRDGIESGADAYLTVPFEPTGLVEAIAHACRQRQAPASAGPVPEASRRRVSIVEAYIRRNIHRRLTVKDLADAAGVSAFHFARDFKAATGETPHDYVMRRRVQEAMALLAGSDLPVAEVGRRLGFATSAHFSAVFRRKVGIAPRAYRYRAGGGARSRARGETKV